MILCLVSAELFSFCNAMVPWLLVLLTEVYLLAHILSQTNFLLNYRLVYFESNFSIAWRLEVFLLFFSRWHYSTSFWFSYLSCLWLYLRICTFHLPLPLFGVLLVLSSSPPAPLGGHWCLTITGVTVVIGSAARGKWVTVTSAASEITWLRRTTAMVGRTGW